MSNEYFEFSTGDHIKLSNNFNSQEFECPGTSKEIKQKISKDLITKLQHLREELNESLTITSGFRTPEHNAAEGGAKNSQHLYGNAADFTCKDLDKAFELCQTLFHGIGDGRHKGKFIHVDVRPLPKDNHVAKWTY